MIIYLANEMTVVPTLFPLCAKKLSVISYASGRALHFSRKSPEDGEQNDDLTLLLRDDGGMPSDPEFEKLVDLYYRDLYRFGFSLTRSEADAADLTQQTFYIWARKGHQLRTSANAKGWLFTTLHREFLQTRRREKRFSDQPLSDITDQFAIVPPDSNAAIDAQTMVEFFSRIDETYRAPLVLYYLEDLSYKEIAEVLGIPLGTVQSRIARGKMRLHQFLTGGAWIEQKEGANE